MRRILWLLIFVLACSGQMCGLFGPNDGSGGDRNICGRRWYDSTYRIGLDLPPGATISLAAPIASADLQRTWTWPDTTPATTFSLIVFQPLAEKTMAEFRDAWLDEFEQGTEFTVLNESYVTLSDGAQGWYLALSPNHQQGITNEFVMTVTQDRLAYVNAVYSADFITDSQAEQVGDTLISLCADLQ